MYECSINILTIGYILIYCDTMRYGSVHM